MVDISDFVSGNKIYANDLQKGKYSLQNYSYPSDLIPSKESGNNQYGNNYVVFFINVSEDSKIIKEGKAPTIDGVDNISPRQRAEIVGRNARNNVTKNTAAGSAVALGALSAIGTATIGLGAGTGIGGGAIAAGALLATGDEIGSFTRPQKRLQTAIALHLPNQLTIRYSTNWQEDDTKLFSYATTGGAEIGKVISEAMNNFSGKDSDTLGAVSNAGSVAQQILAANVLNASEGVSASTGLAQNPLKEQIFNGVDFRTLQMDYQFFPRNLKELENIQRIIQQFKYHMHPEFKDPNNFIFIYPSEFDIAFYHGSEENKNLHRMASSVLIDATVNYTPNGVMNTLPGGAPSQVNMVLTFRELSILTKQQIQEGF